MSLHKQIDHGCAATMSPLALGRLSTTMRDQPRKVALVEPSDLIIKSNINMIIIIKDLLRLALIEPAANKLPWLRQNLLVIAHYPAVVVQQCE